MNPAPATCKATTSFDESGIADYKKEYSPWVLRYCGIKKQSVGLVLVSMLDSRRHRNPHCEVIRRGPFSPETTERCLTWDITGDLTYGAYVG